MGVAKLMILELLKASLAIFIVMDTLGNIPIFFSFMKSPSRPKRLLMAHQTIFVAGIVLFLFLFFGQHILNFFNIEFQSFKIAGGLILLIFGLKLVLGLRVVEENAKQYKMAVVPLATPLITGPGTITTIIILVHQYGFLIPFIASVLNLWVTYLFLKHVDLLHRFLGKQGSDALSKIMGIILTAIAIGFIRQGWIGI